jgi:hypothetical protein
LQETIKTLLRKIQEVGLPPASTLHSFFGKVSASDASCEHLSPAQAVAALLAQQSGEREEEEREREEEGEDGGHPDPYLCSPQIEEDVRGHLIFVEVPALPRRCVLVCAGVCAFVYALVCAVCVCVCLCMYVYV